MMFVLIVFAIWLIYVFTFYRVNKTRFSFSNAMLPLSLFSILVTIDLGFNYLAATNSSLNDGIGMHGYFSYFIFGDDGWSAGLFRKAYDISFLISCLLLLLFMIANFFKPLQKTEIKPASK